ncbi:hypothetical protein [Lactococcus sp.]|uniref:hypothetical protein n=1 Tax=Lactococcus sp. TaxID=44273 RepID=UPI0035AF6050
MAYSKVDRTYHPSKAIREYQDRGMMKWQGFYLSEHSSAMRQWQVEERTPVSADQMENEEKAQLLSQSMLNSFEIVLKMKPGRLEDEQIGSVREWLSPNEILFESRQHKLKHVSVAKILNIKKADLKEWDDY